MERARGPIKASPSAPNGTRKAVKVKAVMRKIVLRNAVKKSVLASSARGTTQVALVALAGIALVLAGCGSQPKKTLDDQLKELHVDHKPTGKFAGTVTIDGQAPRDAIKQGLRIMLYDPSSPPGPNSAPLNAIVDFKTGAFEFSSYSQNDGAPEGKYIVLFAALKHSLLGKDTGYHQPDALLNLYNDPDKNAKIPEFNVTITAPGKSDYHFDLKLIGAEKGVPGPKAITHFTGA